MHKPTVLNCTRTTAMIVFILIGSLFTLTGCAQLYKLFGLSDRQAADQVAQDQAAIAKIAQDVRFTTTEILTTAIAGIGAIASGLLAKWLGTERKITKVLITSIEDANADLTKKTIHKNATRADIEPQLHARVKALT